MQVIFIYLFIQCEPSSHATYHGEAVQLRHLSLVIPSGGLIRWVENKELLSWIPSVGALKHEAWVF